MKRRKALQTLAGFGGIAATAKNTPGMQHGKPLSANAERLGYRDVANCHKGAGTLRLVRLVSHETFRTNFFAVNRGEMPPKTSIGEHIHLRKEEMFINLNVPAQHTVNGRTAELPAGSCVACLKGQSHGIYNHTGQTLQLLQFAVTEKKGVNDSIDYGDDLTKKQVLSPAPFLWTNCDRRLLKQSINVSNGKGGMFFRRMWDTDTFKTDWEYVDHCVLPPGTSIGLHQHNMIEEVYYIVSGRGRVTVNGSTWDVGPGEAIPFTLHDNHGLYNNGREYIELIVCSCAVEKGKRNTVNWGIDLGER